MTFWNSSSLVGHESSSHPPRAAQTVSQDEPPAPLTQTVAEACEAKSAKRNA